jgi:hypothetical protein
VSALDGAEIFDDDDVLQIVKEEKRIMVLGPQEIWEEPCPTTVARPIQIPSPSPTPLIVSETFANYRLPEFSTEIQSLLTQQKDVSRFVTHIIHTIVVDMRSTSKTISYRACRNVVNTLKTKYPESFANGELI